MTRREKFNYLLDEANKLNPDTWDSKILVLEILTVSILLPFAATNPDVNQFVLEIDETISSEENYSITRPRLIQMLTKLVQLKNPEFDVDIPEAV